jgi:glycosyltransferase involved in cell wall biosynthesis
VAVGAASKSLLKRPATLWTVPTESARGRLIEMGAPGESIELLPPAAEAPSDPQARRLAFREELGIADNIFLIVACGEMARGSGHKIASWVHAILRYVHPEAHLLLADGGGQKESILYFADGAGFLDEIHGPWPPSRRADVLAASDAAIVCDERACGTSALAEALAAGLPTVIFPIPDLLECAGEAALAARPATPRAAAQAMLRILEDPAVRDDLSGAARRRAGEQFSADAARQRLAAAYRRAVELAA